MLLNSACFAFLMQKGFTERGFVSCAPSNLSPLQFPSQYELKRVHKNIPLSVNMLHPLFAYLSRWTLNPFIHSPLCPPPPQRGNSLADCSIKNTLTNVLKYGSLCNEDFLFYSLLRWIWWIPLRSATMAMTLRSVKKKSKRTYFYCPLCTLAQSC